MKRQPPIRVLDIMTRCVATVPAHATLADAAKVMWDKNCGFVPVIDPATEAIAGVVTDRDVCMGAFTQGAPLHAIPVTRSMSPKIAACSPQDVLAKVQETMRTHRVRRLPVLDDQRRVVGVLSLDDLARTAMEPPSARSEPHLRREVAKTLGVVARPEPLQELRQACAAE
jgi:CBS domain-containing protein